MADQIILYEFLYRGRFTSEGAPPDYHVVLAQQTTMLGDTRVVHSKPLTPDQAKAQGFDLPAIMEAINTSVMADRDALKTQQLSVSAALSDVTEAVTKAQEAAAALPEDASGADVKAVLDQVLSGVHASLPPEGQP